METFHARYAWASWKTIEQLLPSSPRIDALRSRAKSRAALLTHCDIDRFDKRTVGASESRDFRNLLKWFKDPTFRGTPGKKLIRGARGASHPALSEHALELRNAIIDWVEASVAIHATAPNVDLLTFLESLLNTDFPALLLWSQPQLARRAFVRRNDTLTLSPAMGQKGRQQVQLIQVCLGYLFGYVGRLTPRDAWVGACFGTFASEHTQRTTTIAEGDECITIEPDLAWFRRTWPELAKTPLESGQGAWAYLLAASQGEHLVLAKTLHEMAEQAQPRALDFGAVDVFLKDTARLLEGSAGDGDGKHPWWIHRFVQRELRLGSETARALITTRRQRREQLAATSALVAESGFRRELPPLPLALRVHMQAPLRVVQDAEEWFDWVVYSNPDVPEIFFPEALRHDAAAVYFQTPSATQFVYVEPNPRRIAERYAARMEAPPSFVNIIYDRESVALAPPPHLLDNRLIRLPAKESFVEQAPLDRDALFASTLSVEATQPQLARELRSPRYTTAHEIVPHLIDGSNRVPKTYGNVYPQSRLWSLTRDEAHALANACREPIDLGRYYFLQIALPPFDCRWLLLLHSKKRHVAATHSELSFLYLHHVLRTTEGPVATIELEHSDEPFVNIVNERGEALPAQMIVRGTV